MRRLCVCVVCLAAGCATGPGGVTDKVLQDFGIRERPEGYQSGEVRVFARLNEVGKAELDRLNIENRLGEVKFEEDGELQGRYFKERKVYDNYYPLDTQPTSRGGSTGERGYTGFIEYSYRIYQSPRTSNRVEAAAEAATISTDQTGRETFRYTFNSGGFWDGGEGKRTR